MLKQLIRFTGITLFVGASAALFATTAMAPSEQQKLVNDSQKTLSEFLRDSQMTWLQQNFGRAKAVIIAPELLKAGFIFGGSGGRAIVVARDPKSGKWLGPVFYSMATASVGFQAGISVSENVTLVMTDKGFNSLLATSFKLGGDASIAAARSAPALKATSSRTDHVLARQGCLWRREPRRYGRDVERRVEPGLLRQAGPGAGRPRPRQRQQQGRARPSQRNGSRREEVTIQ
jgi:lipid-binding SYLF domain-containing protein